MKIEQNLWFILAIEFEVGFKKNNCPNHSEFLFTKLNFRNHKKLLCERVNIIAK